MSILKKTRDRFAKILLGSESVPRGLFELNQYFRTYGPMSFKYEQGDGTIVAMSTNFKYGSIVTSGKDDQDLDKNIKDAILTAFNIPSSYAKEASIRNLAENKKEYALA